MVEDYTPRARPRPIGETLLNLTPPWLEGELRTMIRLLLEVRRDLLHRLTVVPALVIMPAVLTMVPVARADEPSGMEFFERKIRPVLVEQCYKCHSSKAKSPKGGLLLDTRERIRHGGDSGPAVVPGDVESSLILDAIRYDLLEMPPDKKLPDPVIADFETWIRMGAPDPREETTTATAEVASAKTIDLAKAREFWSFQPPKTHPAPEVSDPAWIKRPIDAFVLAKLEQAGLSPSPEADRPTLIRRVTFDLTGLPPSPEEVEAFVADEAPDAYERLVDRLLGSPHYGERWARMWLDVARYGEDQAHIVGNDRSLCYPNAYRYRDWVIQALNDDLPYDRFVILQLAADLVEPTNEADLPALGFLGLGPKYYQRNSPAVMADEWEDRVDVVTRGLQGLTVACARCHDHKFDPIPTSDYYALAGVFASTEMFNRPIGEKVETNKNGQAKKPDDAIHIVRDGKSTDLNVYIRGNVNQKGPVAKRHFLSVLSQDDEPEPFARSENESGRRELARSIARRDNPLTARVLVNRVWSQIFGRPLVGTPSNFGALGEMPTHPELLDDLAVRFMESGWSLKWLQRELVLSATYRQSSHADPKTRVVDPENRLLGHMNRRRLDVEAWRDALLSVVGRLDGTVGGPSIDPKDPNERRRTVYSAVSRLELNGMLAMFDFPDPNVHSERRVRTTTPLQKLFVLNSPFMVRLSDALVERLNTDSGEDDRCRIERAYRVLYGRPPTESEIALGIEYLGASPDERRANWPSYAQVLLASNELLMID